MKRTRKIGGGVISTILAANSFTCGLWNFASWPPAPRGVAHLMIAKDVLMMKRSATNGRCAIRAHEPRRRGSPPLDARPAAQLKAAVDGWMRGHGSQSWPAKARPVPATNLRVWPTRSRPRLPRRCSARRCCPMICRSRPTASAIWERRPRRGAAKGYATIIPLFLLWYFVDGRSLNSAIA